MKPGATLTARLRAPGYEETAADLARLARITLDGAGPGEATESVASIAVPGGAVEILPGGDLDLEATERRRAERRQTLESEIERAERKLANKGFVDKAPADVVAVRARQARAPPERARGALTPCP